MFLKDSETLYIITSTLLLLVALITTVKKTGPLTMARSFLALYFWSYFYTVLVTYIVIFGHTQKLPHVFRTAYITWSLVLPCSYMYLVQTFYPRKLKPADLLHLLPMLLYLTDYFPFLMKPAAEKLYLLQHMEPGDIRTGFNEGWFMPKYGYHIIRIAQIICYWLAEVLLLLKIHRSADHPATFENPFQLLWIKFLVASQALLFIGPLIATIFFKIADTGVYSNLTGLIASIVQCYFLVFYPQILYGYSSNLVMPDANKDTLEDAQTMEDEPKTSSGPYSNALLDQIGIELEQWMQQQKPFLQPGYKLPDLAADTGISIHRISAYINQREKLNFYAYLNRFRINHCLGKIAGGEQYSKTLEALAQECGFQNRATFIRAFKNTTGFTPSEYVKTQ